MVRMQADILCQRTWMAYCHLLLRSLLCTEFVLVVVAAAASTAFSPTLLPSWKLRWCCSWWFWQQVFLIAAWRKSRKLGCPLAHPLLSFLFCRWSWLYWCNHSLSCAFATTDIRICWGTVVHRYCWWLMSKFRFARIDAGKQECNGGNKSGKKQLSPFAPSSICHKHGNTAHFIIQRKKIRISFLYYSEPNLGIDISLAAHDIILKQHCSGLSSCHEANYVGLVGIGTTNAKWRLGGSIWPEGPSAQLQHVVGSAANWKLKNSRSQYCYHWKIQRTLWIRTCITF